MAPLINLTPSKYSAEPGANFKEFKPDRSLVVGNLSDWMDFRYLQGCFSYLGIGKVLNSKIDKKKVTYDPVAKKYIYEREGMIEFESRDVAAQVLGEYNGAVMPGPPPTRRFELKWAPLEGMNRG